MEIGESNSNFNVTNQSSTENNSEKRSNISIQNPRDDSSDSEDPDDSENCNVVADGYEDDEIEFSESKFGKPKLFLRDFSYHIQYRGKKFNTWRCDQNLTGGFVWKI